MSILRQPEVSIYDSRRGGPCVRRSDGGRQALALTVTLTGLYQQAPSYEVPERLNEKSRLYYRDCK